MAFFGKLGMARGLAIAGGKAADIYRTDEKDKRKTFIDQLNKFVDNTSPKIAKATAGQRTIYNKVKKDLTGIVNNFLKTKDSKLSNDALYEIASVIYSSHGNNISDVYKDASARKKEHDLNVATNKASGSFSYLNSFIDEGSLKEIRNNKSLRTLEQIANKYARELSPMPTLDLKAKASALGAYKSSAFYKPDEDKIYNQLIAATGYQGPDKAIGEGPNIRFQVQGATLAEEMAAKQSKQNLQTSEKKFQMLGYEEKLLKNKVDNIEKMNEKLVNSIKIQNWRIEDRPLDVKKKKKELEQQKVNLDRTKKALQKEERAIAIGDWTLDNITKWYKFNRDDGYSVIATGYSNGQFLFGKDKETEINNVKQNAFASMFQKIREAEGEGEDGEKRLFTETILGNPDIVANLNVIAKNIKPIDPAGATQEFGKIYMAKTGPRANQPYIYLGLGGEFDTLRLLP